MLAFVNLHSAVGPLLRKPGRGAGPSAVCCRRSRFLWRCADSIVGLLVVILARVQTFLLITAGWPSEKLLTDTAKAQSCSCAILGSHIQTSIVSCQSGVPEQVTYAADMGDSVPGDLVRFQVVFWLTSNTNSSYLHVSTVKVSPVAVHHHIHIRSH